jgi:hypothetical protein
MTDHGTSYAVGSRREWVDRAACRDAPYPEVFTSHNPEDIAEALSWCASCPVKATCFADAAAHAASKAGEWGMDGITQGGRYWSHGHTTRIPQQRGAA